MGATHGITDTVRPHHAAGGIMVRSLISIHAAHGIGDLAHSIIREILKQLKINNPPDQDHIQALIQPLLAGVDEVVGHQYSDGWGT